MPAGGSFWLDESLTLWTIRGGMSSIVRNAFISLQSIAFCAVEWLFWHIDASEFSLRVPSILGACGTAYVLYRTGLAAAGREFGVTLAALFIAAPAVAVEVPNARPYALALFFHAAALYYVLAWLRSGRLKHAVLWVVFAAAAVHLHHMFVTVVPLAGVFMLWRIYTGGTPARFKQLLLCGVIGVLLLAPALPQALVFLRHGKELSFATRPEWRALLEAALPLELLLAAGLAAGVVRLLGKRISWAPQAGAIDLPVLGGLTSLAPIIVFFTISRTTDTQVFISRYLLPAAPGAVLLWGWLLRGAEPALLRRATVILLLAAVVVRVGGSRAVPDYLNEDWRSAVRALPQQGALVVYPGLVETRRLDWLQAPERWPYFMAPVSAYRQGLSPTDAFVLPFDARPREAQAYVESLAARLSDRKVISVIVRTHFYGPPWVEYLAYHLGRAGFRKVAQGGFGKVQVHVFFATR